MVGLDEAEEEVDAQQVRDDEGRLRDGQVGGDGLRHLHLDHGVKAEQPADMTCRCTCAVCSAPSLSWCMVLGACLLEYARAYVCVQTCVFVLLVWQTNGVAPSDVNVWETLGFPKKKENAAELKMHLSQQAGVGGNMQGYPAISARKRSASKAARCHSRCSVMAGEEAPPHLFAQRCQRPTRTPSGVSGRSSSGASR